MNQSDPDTLLAALQYVGRCHGYTVNPEGAISGLPLVEGSLTPELFVRAAERCGLDARIVRRRIGDIHGTTLPVVLIMQGNRSVVLESVSEGGRHRVVAFVKGQMVYEVGREELEGFYTGYAILLKPSPAFAGRSSFVREKARGHWFWGTLWRFRSFYARVAMATVMINLLGLASSMFVMNVYDRVVPNQATETLFVLAAGVGIAYAFEFLLKTLRSFFIDRAGHRVDLILGGDLYHHILGMSYSARPASAGTLASQARSYESLREFFTSATIAVMVDIPFVLVFVGIIFLLGGTWVAMPLLCGVLLTLLIGAVMQIPIGRAVAESYRSGNERQSLFVEGIQALETIKATRSESELQARMEESVRVSSKAENKSRGYSQAVLNLTSLIQSGLSAGIIIAAYFQVIEEKMTMGAMIACVILSGRAMAPLAMLASLISRIQQSRRSLKALGELMEMPMERDERGGRYIALDHFEPRIDTEGLRFRFEEEGPFVLDGLDLTIRPGERVAILGRIGTGKSTLLRLLLGLNEPTEGRLSISGIEIRQIDPGELRGHIGYVPQDPTLLYGTLKSNLKAGCPRVSDGELLRAIQRAGLEDFIRSLPRGIDQPVAEGGRSLSGGQRQSIAVARALIEEPDLLVLDEPTSAMDPTTESHLLKQIDAYLKEDERRTLVVATHKRSLLNIATRVIVIDKGRIVADGPRDAVLKKAAPQLRDAIADPLEAAAKRGTNIAVSVARNPTTLPVGLPN